MDALRSIWCRGGALWRWNEPTAHELDEHSTIASSALIPSTAPRQARGRVAHNASFAQCGYALDVRMRQSGCANALSYNNARWGQRSGSPARYRQCASHGSCACASARMVIPAHAHLCGSAHAHTGSLAHAHTANAAQAHRHSLEHAHTAISAHMHTTNAAPQARLRTLSAWIAHATVYRHDLPCAAGSGAKRRDRRQ